ncbi:MAG TPA: class I SAM-dependent methyltransferase [Pyrinomonadaceae bacterium]|nr:class I SAM-dependent methyltransferase [Pyrinomonadaceae bacterium]
MGLRDFTKEALTRIGARCSPSHMHGLNSVLNYMETGRWLRASGFGDPPRHPTREQLYAALGSKVGGERVLYLEFGVYYGVSMRLWASLLKNPQSSLHGFDSFEGLPEDWDERRPKGEFDVGGRIPEFDDARVVLHKGWFEETLPSFALPERDRLVLNMDADLYSSTRFVLDTLRGEIRTGTIIVFDEFCDRMHELKAFDEFLRETGMGFRTLGATKTLEHVAFERTS